jgi:glutamine amidotransferase
MSIILIDSGIANIHSAAKALELWGTPVKITDRSEDFCQARGIVLPGVGAFDPGMAALKQKDLIHPLQDWVAQDRPLLGICLGMQLLFDRSEEGESAGLGIVSGVVRRLPQVKDVPLPHMGWNQLEIKRNHFLWHHLPPNPWVYFVHSYYAEPNNPSTISATVDYGGYHPTVSVTQGNVMGLQFHPEKSATVGLQILRNFVQSVGLLPKEVNYVES